MHNNIINIFKNRNYTYIKTEQNIIFMKDTQNNIIIIFINNEILNLNNIKDYIKISKDLNIKHFIIIYKSKITPSTKKIILNSDINIEVFEEDECFDITKHKYYYPHIKVDDNIKKEIISKYGNSLPIILKTDPVVKLFNFNKGDVLKILRKDNNIFYRIVK